MSTNSSDSLHFASYYIVLLWAAGRKGRKKEKQREREREPKIWEEFSLWNNQFWGFQYNTMRGKKEVLLVKADQTRENPQDPQTLLGGTSRPAFPAPSWGLSCPTPWEAQSPGQQAGVTLRHSDERFLLPEWTPGTAFGMHSGRVWLKRKKERNVNTSRKHFYLLPSPSYLWN